MNGELMHDFLLVLGLSVLFLAIVIGAAFLIKRYRSQIGKFFKVLWQNGIVAGFFILVLGAISATIFFAYRWGGFLGLIGASFFTIVISFRWLIIPAIIIVPTTHYGLVLRFKKRTGRVIYEGLNFIIPYIDSVELFKEEVVTTPVEESFFSKDNLQVIIKGSVRWKVDVNLLNDVFVTMPENTITTGLVDTIKSELGIIAGTQKGDAFIKSREAIENLINCVLRMKDPFHVMQGLKPAERLKHYEEQFASVRDHLRKEHLLNDDRSDVEERYGIDIVGFSLADVDFSPETKKSLEKKKQTEAELKAQELQFKKKVEMAKTLKEEIGLDPQPAINSAEVTIKQAEKKVFSIEGAEPIIKLIKGVK